MDITAITVTMMINVAVALLLLLLSSLSLSSTAGGSSISINTIPQVNTHWTVINESPALDILTHLKPPFGLRDLLNISCSTRQPRVLSILLSSWVNRLPIFKSLVGIDWEPQSLVLIVSTLPLRYQSVTTI